MVGKIKNVNVIKKSTPCSGITKIIYKFLQIGKFNKNEKSIEFVKYVKYSLEKRKYLYIHCRDFQVAKLRKLLMISPINLSKYPIKINERVKLPLSGIYINCTLKSRGKNVVVTKFRSTF